MDKGFKNPVTKALVAARSLTYPYLSAFLTQLSLYIINDRNECQRLGMNKTAGALNQLAYNLNQASFEVDKVVQTLKEETK